MPFYLYNILIGLLLLQGPDETVYDATKTNIWLQLQLKSFQIQITCGKRSALTSEGLKCCRLEVFIIQDKGS